MILISIPLYLATLAMFYCTYISMWDYQIVPIVSSIWGVGFLISGTYAFFAKSGLNEKEKEVVNK